MNTPKDLLLPQFEVPKIGFKPGEKLISKNVYVFQCPVCHKLFRYDDRYEPLCTGPNETLDEHAPEVMRLLKVDQIKVFV